MRKKILTFKKASGVLINIGCFIAFLTTYLNSQAQTNPTAQNLTYTQNFGTTTFTVMPTGTAAWTVSTSPVGSQSNAESSTPNGNATITAATTIQSTAGCYGYATSSNGRFYIQTGSSGFNGTNQLAAAVNTTNLQNIKVSYDISLISAQGKTIGIVLQYRVGTSGSWTTISGSVYAKNSSSKTPDASFSNLSLPSAANNNNYVQLRWASWAGSESGSYSGCSIDNISITGSVIPSSCYFRSKQSGNWNNTSSWEMSIDSSNWVNATFTPRYICKNITIQSGHQITLTSSDTVDQLVINGTLTYGNYTGNVLTINNGSGVDLTINGTFEDIGPSNINWISSSTWMMGNNGTLLRTRNTSLSSWRDNYNNGISTIPSTANWIIRKTGTDNPLIVSTGAMYYPNLSIENNIPGIWTTTSTSSFTDSSDYPRVKGNLEIGGNGTGGVNFLNENTNSNPVLVQGNLTIKIGSLLRNNGTGFEVQGNLNINGAILYDSDGERKLMFSGNNMQTISGSGTLNVYTCEINKSSSTLILNRALSIDHLLTLGTGKISIGSNDLIFATSATINGYDSSSYIVTSGTGKIIKKYSATGTTFTFATGDSINYTPFSLSLNTATFDSNSYISVRVIDSVEPHVSAYADYASRYWKVNTYNITNLNADINYIYNNSDITGNENNFVATRWNSVSNLKKIGIVTDSSNTASATGISEVGSFGVAGICNVVADAGNDTIIIAGDSIQIGTTPITGYTYSWLPIFGLSNPNIANPRVYISSSKTYVLQVCNSYGCINKDSIKITIATDPNIPPYVDGSVNFKITTGTPAINFNSPPNEIAALISLYGISEISRVYNIEHDVLKRIYTVKFDTALNYTNYPDSVLADSLVSDLKKISYIENAEREFQAQVFHNINDPSYILDHQYLQVINSHPAQDIVLQNAIYSPVIAIIDNGFQINHEDLNPNLWINPGEIQGNGIDDDNNGYINDINGWDFGNNDNIPNAGNGFHGSHVAGLAGARTNNNLGIASISDCGETIHPRLMLLKVFQDGGGGGGANEIGNAILYASENGADVINMSLGGNYPIPILMPALQTLTLLTCFTVQDVIDYANSLNVVCVAAAGNDAQMTPRWPCNLNHVIGVGATNNDDNITYFSNFGTQIDVMAPGFSINSCNQNIDGYQPESGTSMSSPLVAGLAALILTRYPFLPAEAIESCIENTCFNIDDINQYPIYNSSNPPYDVINNQPQNLYQNNLGHGRIDALEAITCIQNNIGHIGILPEDPCPEQPTNLFYYSDTEILAYNWNINPAPQSINSNLISNPEVVFGSTGSYTVTLDAVIAGGNIHEVQIFNISNLPTATISSINNLNQTCDGSSQSIFVQFTGHPPFSITLSDGNQNYIFDNLSQYQSTVYVDVSIDFNTIFIVSVSDLYCENNNIENEIVFNNIVKCCPNMIENGDFENIDPTTTNPNDFPTGISSGIFDFFTDYQFSIYGGINKVSIFPTNNINIFPQHGNRTLVCDGYAELNADAPPQGINANIWKSLPLQISPHQDYYFSFWVNNIWNTFIYTEPNLIYSPGIRLFINGQQINFNNLQNPQNIYFAPVQPERWTHICGIWNSGNNNDATLELKNAMFNYVANSGGNGNDIAIDNIEMHCIENFEITASDDVNFCNGNSVEISVTTLTGGVAPYQYLWSNNAGITQEVEVSPTQTTTYIVTVTDINGCTATDDVIVYVPQTCICNGFGLPFIWTNNMTPLNAQTLYAIHNDVLVTGNNVVLSDATINIDPNITITIDNNASLTLNHCHLYGCEFMWQGIVVKPDGKLIINDAESEGTTLIEDAVLAIDVSNPNANTQLKVDNTIFNKNLDAIKISNYQSNLVTSPYANFVFANSVFTCKDINNYQFGDWPSVATLQNLINTGTLSQQYDLGPYFTTALKHPNEDIPPNCGIMLIDVGTLSGNYFEALIDGDNGNGTINVFDNLLYGIGANNSNVTCRNNAFQNIIGTESLIDGNAIFAINADPTYATLNRLQVTGGNNYFYDCKVAIDVLNYDVVNITDVNIRSNQDPLEGIIGVQILTPRSSGIDVSFNTLTNVMYGILFTALNYTYGGYSNVYNISGTFDISNNIIQADLSGINSFVPGENVTVGIVASTLFNSVPVNQDDCPQLNVVDNKLYDVRNGIQMENWFYFYHELQENLSECYGARPVIANNYISLVDPVNTPPTQFGINTSLNWNGVITNNNVQGFSNDNLGYYGIRCADNKNYTAGPQGNGQGYGQIVECNDMVNTGIGIEFDGDQTGTKFLNNIMEASQMGLVLCNNAALGTQGFQPNFACNNSWPVGSYNTGQYKTYTVNSDAHDSEFVIDASVNDQNPEYGGVAFNWGNPYSWNTKFSSANGSLIAIYADVSNITCTIPSSKSHSASNEQLILPGISSNNQISRLERMVADSVEYTVFAAQQHINDLFRVYRMLEVQPELMDSSVILRNFYTSAQNGNIGALVNTENKLAGGQLSQATSGIAGLMPQNAIESNYKDFYTVYMHYIDSSYTVADSIMLKTLVDGCPVRDGMVVRNARTLYSLIYRDFTLYSDFCIDNNSNKSYENVPVNENIETNLAFDVYPNPNNDKFTIKLKRESLSAITAKVIINNVLGHIVGEIILDFTVNIAIFDNTLSNGVYYFTVIDNKGNIYKTEKVIVLK